MALRRQSVEAVFGQLKSQLGFRQFSLRGLSKVKGEFALLCSAFNIKKLHKCLNYYGKAGSLALLGKFSLKVITFGSFFAHLQRLFAFLRLKIGHPDSMIWIHVISWSQLFMSKNIPAQPDKGRGYYFRKNNELYHVLPSRTYHPDSKIVKN